MPMRGMAGLPTPHKCQKYISKYVVGHGEITDDEGTANTGGINLFLTELRRELRELETRRRGLRALRSPL
jgi:hypothetical protein